jgi:hypothetical protein
MATKQQATYFQYSIIQPTLRHLGLWSVAADELLLGTALIESNLIHRRQLGLGGTALSFFQMEPATHNDIWENFLKYRAQLADRVKQLLTSVNDNKLIELEVNDKYACAMARVHYLRVSAPLPQAGDVARMAAYWKDHYNTWAGAGKESEYIQRWQEVMG